MKIIEVSVSNLKMAEKNVRIHNKVQVAEFARSLKMFGQIRPLVIDEGNEILCGNGMYLAAVDLGWDKLQAIVLDNLTDKQKKKLMIADNRIFEMGSTNNEMLDELFTYLKDDLDIPGYDEETLQMIVGDIEAVNAQILAYGQLEEEATKKFRSNEDILQTKIDRAEQNLSKAGYSNSPGTQGTGEAQSVQTVQSETNRSFVVCPNCGEKIWL